MFKNLSSQAALALALATAPVAVLAAPWATEPAQAASQAGRSSYDGVVEALRQTVVAAQVPGAVVELAVKAGDTVQAGQLLLRIDARSADQSAAAVDAQVQAARAQLDVATREYERQKQLFAKKYISQAALDRAEAEVRAARAQASAQTAQAGAARTQTGLHVVRAPYAGVVAEVPVALGDMAMPGRPLLTLYDPAQPRWASPGRIASLLPVGADHAAAGAGGAAAGHLRRAGHAARGGAADQRHHGQRADPVPRRLVRDVEQMVARPAEQVLSQIAGIEHVMSVSRPAWR
jgi:multidrug efflux pump subunit AcrA (membrane-fusion protein)